MQSSSPLTSSIMPLNHQFQPEGSNRTVKDCVPTFNTIQPLISRNFSTEALFSSRLTPLDRTCLYKRSSDQRFLHQISKSPASVETSSLNSRKTTMAAPSAEILPPSLDSTSEPPPLFDGTTKLYINYQCPFAQRAWITRNYKGLQGKIKLIPIDLQNRPAWYKEKVYPENKVPSLEHNNKVTGESLDLIKYVDTHFEGPKLLPDDPNKKQFAEELLSYSDTFNKIVYSSFKGDPAKETSGAFDHLETALQKFNDGPFFLGQLSLVDFAYIPFVERFQIFFGDVFKYDITAGRPNLVKWIEALNKIDAYKQTKCDPKQVVEIYKTRFMG